jgi:hypothetical protein
LTEEAFAAAVTLLLPVAVNLLEVVVVLLLAPVPDASFDDTAFFSPAEAVVCLDETPVLEGSMLPPLADEVLLGCLDVAGLGAGLAVVVADEGIFAIRNGALAGLTIGSVSLGRMSVAVTAAVVDAMTPEVNCADDVRHIEPSSLATRDPCPPAAPPEEEMSCTDAEGVVVAVAVAVPVGRRGCFVGECEERAGAGTASFVGWEGGDDAAGLEERGGVGLFAQKVGRSRLESEIDRWREGSNGAMDAKFDTINIEP